MSLRDRPSQSLRPRWPAQFDIEGVPRDNEFRQQEKDNRMKLQQQSQDVGIFDFNSPPRQPHVHREYPKMVYKGATTLVVADAEAEKKALTQGYSLKASTKALIKAPKLPRVKQPEEDDDEDEQASV